MKKYYEVYGDLTEKVCQDHHKAGIVGGGHDFAHAFSVAQYAQKIAIGEGYSEKMEELGWLAGILHNTDRLYPEADDETIRALVHSYLVNYTELDVLEGLYVVTAVSVHSPRDIPDYIGVGSDAYVVAILLRDADKVASINGLLPIRSAQAYSNLPAYDVVNGLNDPDATYRNPKTVAKDIWYSLEWREPGRIVTETAKKLAEPGFKVLDADLEDIKRVFEEAGLSPWPLPYH